MDERKRRENSSKISQILSKAWSDPVFKQRLLANPASIVREYGLEVPPGIELRVVEDTDRVRHVILPPPPSSAELSDSQLEQVAGGAATSEGSDPTGYWGGSGGGKYGGGTSSGGGAGSTF